MGSLPPSRPKSKGGKSGQNLKQPSSNSIRRGPKTATKAKPNTVGWRIQKLRREHNLTQIELARRVVVGQAAVSAWETGKVSGKDIPARTLRAVAKELQVTEGYLRTGRDSPLGEALEADHSVHLPALEKGVEVLCLAPEGLGTEALREAQAVKALREAVRAGRPVWLVLG